MAEKIPAHKHCNMCGKSIPVSEKICSDECNEKYQMLLKKGRTLRYVVYIMMVIFALVCFYVLFYQT